jgi:hypothetical protein
MTGDEVAGPTRLRTVEGRRGPGVAARVAVGPGEAGVDAGVDAGGSHGGARATSAGPGTGAVFISTG